MGVPQQLQYCAGGVGAARDGRPSIGASFIDVEIAKWKKVVPPDMRPN
jgi:hypothetical protein